VTALGLIADALSCLAVLVFCAAWMIAMAPVYVVMAIWYLCAREGELPRARVSR
jgi:hypothetical protein